MPSTKSVSSAVPLKSQAHRYAVTECPNPKCPSHKGQPHKIVGPFDGHVMANTYLFTRTYACLHCWWTRAVEMKDDAREAEVKHQRAEKKKKHSREQARRT